MQIKLSLIIFLLCIITHSYSQNLVVNSSFEDSYSCNKLLIPKRPLGWFNVAKTANTGYYLNIPGSTGDMNLELIVGSNYRELRTYWQTMLVKKLQKGKRYKIYMSVASTFGEGPNLNDIGFYFTDSMIFTSMRDTILQPSKYVSFLDSKIKKSKDYWFRLEKEFTAESNNQILIVGNFSKKDYQKIVNNRNRNSQYITIHIDDVIISPIEKNAANNYGKIKDSLYLLSKAEICSLQSPNVNDTITDPIIKPKVDTVLVDADILFASNSFAIKEPDSLEFIRRVLSNENIAKIKIVGFTDDVGTEKYNRELSLKRAQSISSFIKTNFQRPSLVIETEGHGISTKYSDKKLNRRVEIYIFKK